MKKSLVACASTAKAGGIAVAVAKMAFGNQTGFQFKTDLKLEELFLPRQGSILVELDLDEKALRSMEEPIWEKLRDAGALVVGETLAQQEIRYNGQTISLTECFERWESFLEPVFPTKTDLPGIPAVFPAKVPAARKFDFNMRLQPELPLATQITL